MVRHSLDEGLQELMEILKNMGQEVERILLGAMESLRALDRAQAEMWIAEDKKVNDYERQVDDVCVRLIATQQPVARDLRKVISAMKISTDLERMADLAVDIAKVVRRIDGPLMKPLIDIPRMVDLTVEMIRQGLESYVKGDLELAHGLAAQDDQVDHLYNRVVRDLFEIMTARPETLNQGIYLSFVGRYIERIADHATNIGENVLYIATADRQDLNK
ncbi:phosphate signaling complex protein PhoU [Paradesulfitobacterium ferrireducens]|uniref:phosphate signaling complex protein PhoU n=1 Tax=Paradesulfitobacterium ferrireducens TaxID=2816476 RepID=UPI001A905DBB|nr:phosphate signaling complex protein PhoU [Paradesulfitobacterium ferrireducens]